MIQTVDEVALTVLVERALAEDVGSGDIAGRLIPETAKGFGRFLVKSPGVIAGLGVAQSVFAALDPTLTFHMLAQEGDFVKRGQVVAAVTGPCRSILSGERVALNFLQHMSGIATLTRRFVIAVAGTHAIILDTRQTAPGLRLVEHWAVQLGGGQNHHRGQYDAVVIKERHIVAAHNISAAVNQIRAQLGARRLPIEVEVTTLAELTETLPLGVDRITLNNMSLVEMRQAVALTARQIPLQASGNVSLETVGAIAATGVDYICVEAITQAARALDIGLELDMGG